MAVTVGQAPSHEAAGRPVWAIKGLVGYVARAAANCARTPSSSASTAPRRRPARPTTPATRRSGRTSPPTSCPSSRSARGAAHGGVHGRRAARVRGRRRPGQRDGQGAGRRLALRRRHQRPGRVRARRRHDLGAAGPQRRPGERHDGHGGVHAGRVRRRGVAVPRLAALRGDSSDNLPGVRGFGSTTAGACCRRSAASTRPWPRCPRAASTTSRPPWVTWPRATSPPRNPRDRLAEPASDAHAHRHRATRPGLRAPAAGLPPDAPRTRQSRHHSRPVPLGPDRRQSTAARRGDPVRAPARRSPHSAVPARSGEGQLALF